MSISGARMSITAITMTRAQAGGAPLAMPNAASKSVATEPTPTPPGPDPADVRAAIDAFRSITASARIVRPQLKTITWGHDNGTLAALARIRSDLQAAIGAWARLMPKGRSQLDRLQTALGRVNYWIGAIEFVAHDPSWHSGPPQLAFDKLIADIDMLATQADYAAVSIENAYGALLHGDQRRKSK